MERQFLAALFDLDGVVFDTEPSYTDFWGRQCREFHPEIPHLENAIKGQTLTQILDKYFGGALAGVRPLIVERLNEFEANMPFEYIAGFEDFISGLREHNVKTAVVTSSNRQKMEVVYARCPRFKAMFDEILTAEDFEKSKPDPDCYIKAASKLGVKAGESIVFEDSFNGLKSGRAAAMKVVGLSTTNPADAIKPLCDIVIGDFLHFDYRQCAALLAQ